MTKKSYRVPSDTSSYWKSNTSLPSFEPLTKDLEVDVAIVGAGITGITTAYLLRRQGLKIALIESDSILSGTTEYTTAKITAQHGLIYHELIEHFGLEKAKLYYQAAMDAKTWIKDTIADNQITCGFSDEDAYIYTDDDKEIKHIKNETDAYQKMAIEGELVDKMPLEIPIKAALVMKNQAQFHPLHFLKHLVTAIHDDGINIYEQTTAVDIEFSEHPIITTKDNHQITCQHVVIATHYPFHDRSGLYFSRMYQERSYMLAITAKQKFPGGMYINAEQPTRTIRATMDEGEEVWLVGGERHKTGQDKSAIDHHEQLELFADQSFGIKAYKHRWSAQDITTMDKLPYIGPLTTNKPHALVATGYRKWGMTSATVAAMILSDTIMKKANRYAALFSPDRFDFDPDVKNYLKMNADVAKHMLKGKLERTDDDLTGLENNQATIIREKGKRIGVYRDENGQLGRLDTTCPHLKCEVNWNPTEHSWDCPCHGSRFAIDGKVLEGPAKEVLTKIEE